MEEERALDHRALASLLRRVGLDPGQTHAASGDLPKFDPFRDPAATDLLGRELARKLRALDANAVCVWEEPEDLVLGHVLGLALGVRLARCVNADGLAALLGVLPQAARCVIATDAVRAPEPIAAMRSLIQIHGGEVVAVAALLATPELEGFGGGTVAALSLDGPDHDASSGV